MKASGPSHGGGYLESGGTRLTKKQSRAARFKSRFAAEAAAERFDSVSPPPVKRLRLRLRDHAAPAARCYVTDCKGKVMARITYISKETGEKGGAPYCLEHGEMKLKQFRKLAKDGKVTIDKSPQTRR